MIFSFATKIYSLGHTHTQFTFLITRALLLIPLLLFMFVLFVNFYKNCGFIRHSIVTFVTIRTYIGLTEFFSSVLAINYILPVFSVLLHHRLNHRLDRRPLNLNSFIFKYCLAWFAGNGVNFDSCLPSFFPFEMNHFFISFVYLLGLFH